MTDNEKKLFDKGKMIGYNEGLRLAAKLCERRACKLDSGGAIADKLRIEILREIIVGC